MTTYTINDTVNLQTKRGSVDCAIAKRNPTASEGDAWLLAMARALGGRGVRGPKDYRYIHPDHIAEVRSPRKACPVTLTPAQSSKLSSEGWVQVRYGTEFVEQSYVVGATRANAQRGSTYDTNDRIVYQDPTTNLFWRNTGCLD